MPMMPIEPAKAVMKVRPFLVMRLLAERESAVSSPIEECFLGASAPLARATSSASSSEPMGRESSTMRPSLMRTMRVA